MPANNIVTDKLGIGFVTLTSGQYVFNTYEQAKSLPTFSDTGLSVISIDLNQSTNTYASYITEENLIQNNIPTGVVFSYMLYEGNTYELGFGKILPSANILYLSRDYPTYFYDGSIKNRIFAPTEFTQPKLFIQSSAPLSLEETMVFGNSVICTSASGATNIVALENNTLLGCKNNNLQSIDNAELIEMFGEDIPSAINSKTISPASINVSTIRLLPSQRPINPPRGTIVYNDDNNNLEFYDGNSWRTL